MNGLEEQIIRLAILGIPVATVTWTATHEEVLGELREWCSHKSKTCGRLYQRKFFYLLTCEYCLSHYVAAIFLASTGFQLLLPGWRGYFLSWLALVWIANIYMSLFGRLRLDIRHERLEIENTQKETRDPALHGKRADAYLEGGSPTVISQRFYQVGGMWPAGSSFLHYSSHLRATKLALKRHT